MDGELDHGKSAVGAFVTGLFARLGTYVNKHFTAITFLLICVVGGPVLDNATDWQSDDGTPPPWHFSVLRYDESTGSFR